MLPTVVAKLVAHSRGKTSFCLPPSSVPRWRRWWEGMIRRWSLRCILLSHGTPQKLGLAPTFSFMPWGHCCCHFFCHMVFLFCRESFLLAVGFFLLPWVSSFCREVFSFAVKLSLFAVLLFLFVVRFFLPLWVFSFAVSLFLLRRSYSFCRYSCGHRNRIAQMIFKWEFWFFFFFTRVKRVVQTFLSWTRGGDKCAWSLFPSSQRYGGTNHTFFSPNSSVSLI